MISRAGRLDAGCWMLEAVTNITHLLYVSFDADIWRSEHVTCDLDIAMDRQSLVRSICIDANRSLWIYIHNSINCLFY